MFNRIRGALARARSQRQASRGRHRQIPVTPARPTVVHLGHTVQRFGVARCDVLAGEETALVRPYVLAAEERARRVAARAHMAASVGTWAPEVAQ